MQLVPSQEMNMTMTMTQEEELQSTKQCGLSAGRGGSPGEDQAEQRADENENLVEHGRVGPLDHPVDVILPRPAYKERFSLHVMLIDEL